MSNRTLFPTLLFLAAIVAAHFAEKPLPARTIPLQTTGYSNESAQTPPPYPLLADAPIRNVILFIGDGMGLNQISASRLHLYGPHGRLHIERMPVSGALTTHCEDSLITDSGAAASALATGFKVPYNAISTNKGGEILYTILEAARDKGMATGLVTTTEIVDATPAAFASHVTHRRGHNVIAQQLVESRIDVLLGGGKNHFLPRGTGSSERTDDIDLLERIKQLGYTYVENSEELTQTDSEKIFGLFPTENISSVTPDPTIQRMTKKALEILARKKSGFFLMVETERTDEESHANRFEPLAQAMRDFDEAVKLGIEFAMNHEQTLVIVTADHETGGLQIDKGGPITGKIQLAWTTRGHTGQTVPLFAFGPHAMKFTGLKDNTELPRTIAQLLGVRDFPRVISKQAAGN
ncbi:MAG TPA: alkaline phosphatase [Bacteroidota bacterium]|nr:alkaline phosphatase [Bacteroidota bacterium]